MSVKISALPAAAGGNITEVSLLPLVDSTTTTVKVTMPQLRTQLFNVAGTFTLGTNIANAQPISFYDSGAVSRRGMVLSAINQYIVGDVDNIGYASFLCGSSISLRAGAVVAMTVASALVTSAVAHSFSGTATIASGATSVAGAGTDIVLGATTQATIGANGAASALTANPLGYLVFFKGATKCVLPYYNG